MHYREGTLPSLHRIQLCWHSTAAESLPAADITPTYLNTISSVRRKATGSIRLGLLRND